MTSTAQAAQIRANIEAMRQEAIAANPIYDMAPNQIGRHVAHAMRWDGDEIFDVMLAALIDANFHKEAEALRTAWNAA